MGKLLLIVVEDVEGEVLVMLVVNVICKMLKVVVVKGLYFGDCCKVFFEDLVVVMGG